MTAGIKLSVVWNPDLLQVLRVIELQMWYCVVYTFFLFFIVSAFLWNKCVISNACGSRGWSSTLWRPGGENVYVTVAVIMWPVCIVAQETRLGHQCEEMEVTPLSTVDDRSQQDSAALHGSTTWAAKQTIPDTSLADDRTVSHWSLYLCVTRSPGG